MHEFQIPPSAVQAAYGAMKPTRAKQKKALERPKPRRVVPEKYRHPETGETWTGRGRAPRRLAAAERAAPAVSNSESEESFVTDGRPCPRP